MLTISGAFLSYLYLGRDVMVAGSDLGHPGTVVAAAAPRGTAKHPSSADFTHDPISKVCFGFA